MSYPETLSIAVAPDRRVTGLAYPAGQANRLDVTLVLAHGAGAPQTHAFMVAFATALASRGLDVGTFNFLYTEARRRTPDPPAELEGCWRAALAAFRDRAGGRPIFVGGKSMGGRIATQVVAANDDDREAVAGLVLLGYPLHPPGRPRQLRSAHLPAVGRPMLFVQGSRDSFGRPDELSPVLERLAPRPTIHVVEGGDHSFKVPAASPVPQEDVYREIEEKIVAWVTSVSGAGAKTARG